MVCRNRPARCAGGILAPGNSDARPTRSRPCRPGFSPSGISWRCFTHFESSSPATFSASRRNTSGLSGSVSRLSASCSCRFSIGAPPSTSQPPVHGTRHRRARVLRRARESSDTWLPDMRRHSARNATRMTGLLIVGALVCAARASAQAPVDGCVSCHTSLTESRLSSPVTAFATDVHNERGSPMRRLPWRQSDDAGQSSRKRSGARLSRADRPGTQIVATCARCHSDAALMRKFAPS